MTGSRPIAAVSGASGYLGSKICQALESNGWDVVRLVRKPDVTNSLSRRFDLEEPVPVGALTSVDLLIHAAYDLAATARTEIWRINVGGTARLLAAARDAGVTKIIVLSSMSAFEGTGQLYGRAKLEIEKITSTCGGCSIRPGLVYGDNPGGTSGALRKIAKLPIIPLPWRGGYQYPIHENDLMSVIVALSAAEELPPGPIGIAQSDPVPFRDVLRTFARQEGRLKSRFLPVPWKLIYWALRSAELARIPVPFRADSLLGLVRSAPNLPGQPQLERLNVPIRLFPSSTTLIEGSNGPGRATP